MDEQPRELTVTVRITDGGLVLPADLVRAAGLDCGARVLSVNDGKLLVSPLPGRYDGEVPEDAEPPYYTDEEMRRINDDLERYGPHIAVMPGEEGYEEALENSRRDDDDDDDEAAMAREGQEGARGDQEAAA